MSRSQIGQDVPAAVARSVCRRVSPAGPAQPARPAACSSSHPAPTSTAAAEPGARSWPPARVLRERLATLPRTRPATLPRARPRDPSPPCLTGPFPRRPDLPPYPQVTLRFPADHALYLRAFVLCVCRFPFHPREPLRVMKPDFHHSTAMRFFCVPGSCSPCEADLFIKPFSSFLTGHLSSLP